MQNTIMKLVDAMKANPTLVSEMKAATTPEAKAAVASKNGFSVSAQEFKALQDMEKAGEGGSELSDADLELVAGGSLKSIWREIKKTARDVYKALVG